MNIRVALPAFLKANSAATALVSGRVSHIVREQGVGGSYLVFRVIRETFGDVIAGDSTERTAAVEIVAWCLSTADCIPIAELLTTLFHGTGGYSLGGLAIQSSMQLDRHDGDRVCDQYSDSGEFPITSVFEFRWNA